MRLDEAVAGFVGRRPSYGTPVRAFLREFSLGEVGEVQPGLTVGFVEGLQERGFSVRTVHRYRQAVNAFLGLSLIHISEPTRPSP